MGWIKGITVKLHEKTQTGIDPFDQPIYSETTKDIENVLVTPVSSSDVLDTLNLTGKMAMYELCIPKGDTNEWENTVVEFYGKTWRTIGIPYEYIEEMLPLDWNKRIRVERYE